MRKWVVAGLVDSERGYLEALEKLTKVQAEVLLEILCDDQGRYYAQNHYLRRVRMLSYTLCSHKRQAKSSDIYNNKKRDLQIFFLGF